MISDKDWDSWITCESCDAEFKILTVVSSGNIEFCPFCASELEQDDSDFAFDEDE